MRSIPEEPGPNRLFIVGVSHRRVYEQQVVLPVRD